MTKCPQRCVATFIGPSRGPVKRATIRSGGTYVERGRGHHRRGRQRGEHCLQPGAPRRQTRHPPRAAAPGRGRPGQVGLPRAHALHQGGRVPARLGKPQGISQLRHRGGRRLWLRGAGFRAGCGLHPRRGAPGQCGHAAAPGHSIRFPPSTVSSSCWATPAHPSRRRPPSADVSRSGSSRASRRRRTSRASARPASRRGNPGSMQRTTGSSGRPSPARPPYFAAAFFAGFFLAAFACSAARQRYQEAVVRCGRQRSPYSWSALGDGKARRP
jgi:hypothetical protein